MGFFKIIFEVEIDCYNLSRFTNTTLPDFLLLIVKSVFVWSVYCCYCCCCCGGCFGGCYCCGPVCVVVVVWLYNV